MFKNRGIQVQFVNTKKNPESNTASEPTAPVDYSELVRETTELIAKNAVIGVGIYIAADTLRQVLVKLTPEH